VSGSLGKNCGCKPRLPAARPAAQSLSAAARGGFQVDGQGRRIEPSGGPKRCGCHQKGAQVAGEDSGSESSLPESHALALPISLGAPEPWSSLGAPEPWSEIGSLPDGDPGSAVGATPAFSFEALVSERDAHIPIGARPSVTPREILPVRLVPQITFGENAPTILLQCAREIRSNPPYLRPNQDPRMVESRWLTACASRKGLSPEGLAYVVLPDGRFYVAPPSFRGSAPPWYPGIPPPPYLQPLPMPPYEPGVPTPPGPPYPIYPTPIQPRLGGPGGPTPPPSYVGPSAIDPAQAPIESPPDNAATGDGATSV
jgi:hypothetical protein